MPRLCQWILAQASDRFVAPTDQLGGDFGRMTVREAITTLPRALRWGEITAQTVESVLTALTHNMSLDDMTTLRREYADEMALQRKVNGDSDDDVP